MWGGHPFQYRFNLPYVIIILIFMIICLLLQQQPLPLQLQLLLLLQLQLLMLLLSFGNKNFVCEGGPSHGVELVSLKLLLGLHAAGFRLRPPADVLTSISTCPWKGEQCVRQQRGRLGAVALSL